MIKAGRIESISIVSIFLIIITSSLFGESVLFNDGSIVEGKIVKDTDDSISLKGKAFDAVIKRKDIIRTVYHSSFKEKKFITTTDGSIHEVYIVDEDRTCYTCREKLDSNREIKILKEDVDTISKRRIVAANSANDGKNQSGKRSQDISEKKEMTSEEETRIRAPRIRLGLSTDNPDTNSIVDLFLYRMRDEDSSGLDFLMRHVRNVYSDGDQNGFGVGVRYINGGWYFTGMLWQVYGLAYYQYSGITYIHQHYSSHGIVGGAGLEIGLFRYPLII